MDHAIGEDELLRVLRGMNPWWAGERPVVPAFTRVAYDECRRWLLERRRPQGLLLFGPRGVGKTTLLIQLVAALLAEGRDPRTILYLPLDHPLFDLASFGRARSAYDAYVRPLGATATLLLDELGYAVDLDPELAKLFQLHRDRILATSSVKPVDPDALEDRGEKLWASVAMTTLSFHEFVRLRGDPLPSARTVPTDLAHTDFFRSGRREADLARVATALQPLIPAFERYLYGGGYPALAHETDLRAVQSALRTDVVGRVLEGDIALLLGVRSAKELRKLFLYLCLHAGEVLSIQSCAALLGTTAVTVTSHLAALARAHLIYLVPSRGPTGLEADKPRYRVLLLEGALSHAMLAEGGASVRPRQAVQSAVLRHLAAYEDGDRPKPTYWRFPGTGEELDFVLRSKEQILPVTVDVVDGEEVPNDAAIRRYCLLDEVRRGYWITRHERTMGVVGIKGARARVLRVTPQVLLFLIGQAEAGRRRM